MPATTSPSPAALVLSGGWFVAGTLWFVQALVPWTATGTLSHSSTLDAASLIRSGAVGSLAPSFAGWLLLMVPCVGLVLSASAFSTHRIAQGFRVVAVMVTLAATGLLTHYLTDFQITDFGPGALLAWLGCAVCVVALGAQLVSRSS